MVSLSELVQEHEPQACLGCDRPLAESGSVGGEFKVASGVLTICLHCGYVQAFTDDLSLRPLTIDERKFCETDPDTLIVREAIQRAIEKRKSNA